MMNWKEEIWYFLIERLDISFTSGVGIIKWLIGIYREVFTFRGSWYDDDRTQQKNFYRDDDDVYFEKFLLSMVFVLPVN